MTTPVQCGEESAALRPSILIVDDRPENIRMVGLMLSGFNADILSASSGPQALELLDSREFACVLLDVRMPRMDGFEVARRIRSRGNPVPIIFATNMDRAEEPVTRAYSLGAADFIFRPLEPISLCAKLQVFCDLFGLRQAEHSRVLQLEALHQDLLQRQGEAENMLAELALQKADIERSNRELTARNSQLNSFTHVVSHDLRQPLGSILDYLDLIQEATGESLDVSTSRWIKSCRRLGRNMQALIEDVLDYSRLGAQPLAMSPVPMNGALNQALDNLLAAVKESGAMVSYDALPTVLGSENLLTCLLQNLIGNAIKYRGAEPPKVHVSCARRDDDRKWGFRIVDNGRGFKSADRERIFEMFSRCENAGGIPGTGIGLAICKKIVDAHGGHIWAESESGRGTEFHFVLQDGGSDG